MPGGYEGATRVLVLDAGDAGSLADAIAAVAEGGADHVVGIATSISAEGWIDALRGTEGSVDSAIILDATDAEPTTDPTAGAPGIQIRDHTGVSLGDLGSSAVDAIAAGGQNRPAVLLDSVAALTDDPGTRFKFLDLLGRRVARDDGQLRALEGRPPLPEHERQTVREVFDAVTEPRESA
jgi:hypothetical protein